MKWHSMNSDKINIPMRRPNHTYTNNSGILRKCGSFRIITHLLFLTSVQFLLIGGAFKFASQR